MANYQIRSDVYPAAVTLTSEDGTETQYEKVRIIVTLDHVYVFRDAQPAPEIVFEDRLVSYTPPIPATRVRRAAQLLNRSATFETADEMSGEFIKMGGCGCGSRLKTISLTNLLPDSPIHQVMSSNDQ